MSEKRMIFITGATDGIGKATAMQLASLGYPIAIHGRNKERLEQTRKEIISKTNSKNVQTFQADFSNLLEVKEMANQINKFFPDLYCLINNAGTFQTKRILNSDGYELTFTINHLAPFLLTLLVLEKLKSGFYFIGTIQLKNVT